MESTQHNDYFTVTNQGYYKYAYSCDDSVQSLVVGIVWDMV